MFYRCDARGGGSAIRLRFRYERLGVTDSHSARGIR